MHRAKGLEFDTVVLLGLAREPRPDEPKALQWLARATADGRDDLRHGAGRVRERADGARLARLRAPRGTRARRRRARAAALRRHDARPRAPASRLAAAGRRGSAAGELAARASMARRFRPRRARPRRAAAPAAADAVAITPVLRRLVEPAGARGQRRARQARPRAVRAGVRLGRAKPPRTSAPSCIATCSASRSRGSSAGAVQRVAEAQPAFARELELLGVEAAERASAADRVVAALSRVARRPRTGAGCSGRTTRRARSSG